MTGLLATLKSLDGIVRFKVAKIKVLILQGDGLSDMFDF
jgi:hypothetical protein